jgi:hypothetical protein
MEHSPPSQLSFFPRAIDLALRPPAASPARPVSLEVSLRYGRPLAMPDSDIQTEANRRNAQHSTGPKTPAGKAAPGGAPSAEK